MRTWIFFATAVLLNYGTDIAPYYVRIFSDGNLDVIGMIRSLGTRCNDTSVPDLDCAVEYVIPLKKYSAPQDSLGAGFFPGVLKAYCKQDREIISLNDISDGEGSLLNQYRVVNLQGRRCEDVILRNFVQKSQTRFGHSSGAVSIGKSNWVARAKALTEVFRKQLFLCLAAILLAAYFSAMRFRKLLNFRHVASP